MRRTFAAVLLVAISAACGVFGSDGGEQTLVVNFASNLEPDQMAAMEQALLERIEAVGARGSVQVAAQDARIELTQGDTQLVASAVQVQGMLHFRPVIEVLPPDASPPFMPMEPNPDAPVVRPQLENGQMVGVYRLGPAALEREAVQSAKPLPPQDREGWMVLIRLTPQGAEGLDALAAKMIGRQVAILVDDRVISAPVVHSPSFGGEAVISGGGAMTESEARGLATALNTSQLPVEVEGVGSG